MDAQLDPQAMPGSPPNRRAEYAEATRQAIVAAARRLYREKGYFATKVDEIAAAARVAPATVYAVGGGKQGLLHTLIDTWTTAPIVADTYAQLEKLDDPDAILAMIAEVTRKMRADWGDIMRVVLATAPHDANAAASLTVATDRYRSAYVATAKRLAELGALRDGMDVGDAVDVLWFYFGYSAFFTLLDDNKWSPDKAQQWLYEAAGHALFPDGPSRSGS
jgi:AcrR family transcriptional regulator